MIDFNTDALEKIFLQKEVILAFIKENNKILDPFLSQKKGVLKTQDNTEDSYSSTSTAYVIYYLSEVLGQCSTSELPSAFLKPLKSIIIDNTTDLSSSFLNEHNENGTENGLPNNYNTPIQIAGLLSGLAFRKEKLDKNTEVYIRSLLDSNTDSYIKQIIENRGFIRRWVLEQSKAPSPYHTFWVLTCLTLYDEMYDTELTGEIFELLAEWSVSTLAKSISFTYAGLSQSFDAIEVSYLLLILLTLAKEERVHDRNSIMNNASKLIEHAIGLLYSNYFVNGCFTKSLPVFSDSKNFSLSCPTVEPIALLVLKHKEYFYEHTENLIETYNWINGTKFKLSNNSIWTWRSEWEHFSSEPNSFMAVSVVAFLAGLFCHLDNLLSVKASLALNIAPFHKDGESQKIKYPGDLGKIVDNYIVSPIKNNHKDIAHYSIILFGPPGTSKTTISKKIAQDLEWPLVVINANNFLKGGMDKIDSEADRIFRLVSYLNNTVVLFDEVEELVLNRESNDKQGVKSDQKSRLLTTSMLPRINDLRSTSKVVFIFATNYLNHIDKAIIRTGRFDCVHCVMPPDESERIEILKSLSIKHNIPSDSPLQNELITNSTIKATEKFCYADLRDLVKRVVIEVAKEEAKDRNNISRIITNEITVGKGATIEEAQYELFVSNKKKFDRPNPKS